jgi:hypothetical protein
VLHTADATTPTLTLGAYIGDYLRMVAVGANFYGVFSGSNAPITTNFPRGITYQRKVDWTKQQLLYPMLGSGPLLPVPVSIDPFFFSLDPTFALDPTIPPPTGFAAPSPAPHAGPPGATL